MHIALLKALPTDDEIEEKGDAHAGAYLSRLKEGSASQYQALLRRGATPWAGEVRPLLVPAASTCNDRSYPHSGYRPACTLAQYRWPHINQPTAAWRTYLRSSSMRSSRCVGPARPSVTRTAMVAMAAVLVDRST